MVGTIVFAFLLIVVSGLVITTNQKANDLVDQETIANKIALEIGELGYLSDDYILYREPQQEERWITKYTSISGHIANLSVDTAEQQAIVESLRTNLLNTKAVFDDITSSPLQPEGTGISFVQLSWSRMAVQNQGMVFDAGRLANLLRIQTDSLREARNLLILALVGAFVAFILTSYVLFYRRTLTSIAKLQKGSRIIGSGNLGYTIDQEGDDEISELAESFNRMTSDLKNVIATKADLEVEIIGRKQAEQQLVQANTLLRTNEQDLIRQNDELNELNEELVSTQEELRQNLDELIRVQQELRKSEGKYRNLFERMTEGFAVHEIVCDDHGVPKDYRFLEINPAFEQLTGLRRDDTVGRLVTEVLPGTEQFWIDRYGAIALTGRPDQFESYSQVLEKYYNVFAYSPAPRQFAVMFNDITERKRAENALRESEERLQMAQKAAGAGTWDWNIKTGVLIWSPQLFTLFGLDPENDQSSFDTWNRVLHPEDLSGATERIERSLQSHTTLSSEYRIILPDGMTRWIYFLGEGMYDERGSPVRMTGICMDITDRKQAEVRLRESEERLRFALETSHTGAWDLDLRDHTAYRSLEHDRIFGYPDLLPQWTYEMFLDHVLPEDRSHVDSSFRKATETGGDWSFECRIRRNDGKIRWIWAAGRHRLDTGGGLYRMAGIVQDITERKEAEEALKEYTENLKRSNEDLERFAYIASHDLQEPLRNVVSFSQLLSRRYKEKISADADEYIGYIVEGGKRMQALVQDLLEYSRVNTRGQAFEPVDCEPIVEKVTQNLHSQITESDAMIVSESLPTILGDPSQIYLVFQNLIGNAVKFRKENVPPKIRLSAEKTGKMWKFAVKDNGIGIEPAYYNRIFEIFQRLHTRDKYQGTGVGLAIVKRIIERHGGEIWVESRNGEGSTFYFTLPDPVQ